MLSKNVYSQYLNSLFWCSMQDKVDGVATCCLVLEVICQQALETLDQSVCWLSSSMS